MTLTDLSPLANHLWQSTIFAIAAWLLTLAPLKKEPRLRPLLDLVRGIIKIPNPLLAPSSHRK